MLRVERLNLPDLARQSQGKLTKPLCGKIRFSTIRAEAIPDGYRSHADLASSSPTPSPCTTAPHPPRSSRAASPLSKHRRAARPGPPVW